MFDASTHTITTTSPLGRSVSFKYDADGRVTSQSLADGNVIGYSYDENGNLTSITPPGRPAHVFSYTTIDQRSSYTPPKVGAQTDETLYTYNPDRQLTQIRRPDGETLDFNYDTAGRLDTLVMPQGKITYDYNATTGNVNQIATDAGSTLALSYDGSLVTGLDWTGQVAGQVGFTYDNNFRITGVSVNGASPIAYQYDNDSLLTQAGDLSISRDSQNGLVSGSTLGGMSDSLSYDAFGEVASYTASYNGNAVFSNQYTRDKLGRITEKSETLDGTTSVFD